MEGSGDRYLITLVHGTWGRGFFRPSIDPSSPKWFENNSPFRRELETALAKDAFNYQIQQFHWSGRNSVRARDTAALDLANHIVAHSHFNKHLVIAHSHGGNVATRSLAHLIGSDASVEIVTLSTPFMKFYESAGIEARFDGFRDLERLICIVVALLFWNVCASQMDSTSLLAFVVNWISIPIGLVIGLIVGSILGAFADRFNYTTATQHTGKRSSLLVEATRFPPYSTNLRRFLVLRGIDDEATLALAFGALLSWLSGLLFRGLGRTGPPMILLGKFLLWLAFVVAPPWRDKLIEYAGGFGLTIQLVFYGYLTVTVIMCLLVIAICLGKGAFGTELLRGSVRIEIDSGNAPSLATDLTVVTLRPDLSLKTAGRHFLYENEGCVLAIVSWLRDNRVAVTWNYDPRTKAEHHYPSLRYDR